MDFKDTELGRAIGTLEGKIDGYSERFDSIDATQNTIFNKLDEQKDKMHKCQMKQQHRNDEVNARIDAEKTARETSNGTPDSPAKQNIILENKGTVATLALVIVSAVLAYFGMGGA